VFVQFHVLGTDKIKILFHGAAKRNDGVKVTVQSSTIQPITNIEVLAITPGAQKVVILSTHVRFHLMFRCSLLLSDLLNEQSTCNATWLESREPKLLQYT
jgi:hypothetical protein